jgi:hypothetical protein
MKTLTLTLTAALAVLAIASEASAQQAPFDRLSAEQFNVVPPSVRVTGAPGDMSVQRLSCPTLPITDVRRRIVDVAVQEWAFFGFRVVDQTDVQNGQNGQNVQNGQNAGRGTRTTGGRRPRLSATESTRIADSIGGFWAVTPDGSWMIARQNERWNGSAGVSSRWRDPWSAAFISWVMCEGGLGDTSQFKRAIAHHTYIDQAIRARDGRDAQAAFVAYDAGEVAISPGDLLCSGSRPGYRTLNERRRQMGVGARTHCDVVVKVDEAADQILTVGGNVGSSVSMKRMPATRTDDNFLRTLSAGRRPIFAHLKLRAESIEPDALDNTPTIKAAGCAPDFTPPALLTATNLRISESITSQC